MAGSGISMTGIGVRLLLAILLVFGTFNPSGYSIYHWLAGDPIGVTPGKVLAFLLLVIGWFVCVRTALISMGWVGMTLGACFLAAVVWLLTDRGLISMSGTAIVWLSLLVIGVLLGTGLSWSLLRAKATGQLEVQ